MALLACEGVCRSRTAFRSLVVQGVDLDGCCIGILLLALGLGEAGKGEPVEAGLDLGGSNALAGGGTGGRPDQSGEAVDGTGVIDNHRPLVPLGKNEAIVGQGIPKGGSGAAGGPGGQRGGAHLHQRDGGSLLLVAFAGCQRGDGARAEGVTFVHKGAMNVWVFAAKGVEDGAFVTAG